VQFASTTTSAMVKAQPTNFVERAAVIVV